MNCLANTTVILTAAIKTLSLFDSSAIIGVVKAVNVVSSGGLLMLGDCIQQNIGIMSNYPSIYTYITHRPLCASSAAPPSRRASFGAS